MLVNVFVMFAFVSLTVLSLLLNLRSWLGRGGGRIKIGDSWFDVSRRELREIINNEMTDQEYNDMQEALARAHTDEAQRLLGSAGLRYLRRLGRIQ